MALRCLSTRFVRQLTRPLPALLAAAAFGLSAPLPAVAAEPVSSILLPGKPSEWLSASDAQWQDVLKAAGALMDARRAQWSTLSPNERVEWYIHSAVMAQAEGRWQAVIDAVKSARELQASEAGRQTAGLLNELLARQALSGGSDASLRRITREAVLAMPWAEVEPAIQGIRQALAGMDAKAVQTFVESRMDLATGITKGQVTLPFVMQLLGARFQLQQVLPRRPALMVGLDDAIRQRTGPAPTS